MSPIDPVQKSLLKGEWDSKGDAELPEELLTMAKGVVEGRFREHLTSPSVRALLALHDDLDLSKPLKTWFRISTSESSNYLSRSDEILLLITAIASLHAFLQGNWTGPDLDVRPLDILPVPGPLSEKITEDLLQSISVAELALGGEPAYHLAEATFLLRLTQIILDLPFQHVESAIWWRLRAYSVHEQILDEAVALPEGTLPPFDTLADAYSSDLDLVGRLWLECGLLEHYQGNDRAALEYFVRAARATGLEYELTGALGKRTRFQQTELSQLVLLAESRARDREEDTSKASEAPAVPETLALNDDTLLEQTEFTSSHPAAPGSRLAHLDPSAQPALHPLDQCILLSLCLNVRNTSPQHGLTHEQMAPYVARVAAHPRNWSVHTMALLIRSRLEAHRTRTVERAVLQLQALLDQMPTADSVVPERLQYIHAIPLPSKWALQRELASRLLSIGVIKSALEIFERLEMWEDAVRCHQTTEQREIARSLVRDLLEGRKAAADAVLEHGRAYSAARRGALDAAREAKLWCILGELEPECAVAHFEKAWQVSQGTSGRAMRSLGGHYFARERYADAARCLRKAVAINPLQVRSWFVLGCAWVRIENWEGAREAFVRCVALDEEDGESWNNLASVYLRMKNREEDLQQGSIPFQSKILAFRALQQGLRFSYENWRMWMNYMIVAMDVGELAEASRALGRIVEERATKIGADAVDEDVLDRLVDAITRAPSDPNEAIENAGIAKDASFNPNEGHGLLRRVTDLFERVLLPRVSSPRIFRARARLLMWQSRWEDALKAHLDAYRSGVAGTMEKGETDVERWHDGVREVEETVDLLRNFGPRVEGFKWKLQAKSIIRTFMGRTRDFQDEPEWRKLENLKEDLENES
ncbi:hypothetical protein K488DRAFT_56076 [Vararia minispora EC-137]|uniref:Uncharacterized protein n=1 Tax=Vararia minispora EC-137 TaxID=1314806 RepID=A0ACB8QD02_9AGAM|nr:hypothetical protein K488DRAFT_56076 [Vararia minispora EC-137]